MPLTVTERIEDLERWKRAMEATVERMDMERRTFVNHTRKMALTVSRLLKEKELLMEALETQRKTTAATRALFARAAGGSSSS